MRRKFLIRCLGNNIIWLLLTLINPSSVVAAAWENNRLVPLQKITVGPWDNFAASITSDDSQIYFTRNRTQIPMIFRQNLYSNDADVFIGAEGDAKDPTLQTAQQYLAMTYYKTDAQGDICLVKLLQKIIHCITDHQTIDESPFWIGTHQLGYLSRSSVDLAWNLQIYDIKTQQSQKIHQGIISAPIASPDGRYIIFNQTEPGNDGNDNIYLQIYDQQTKTIITPARFDLSGITGFMSFSQDGQFLYFNHYLNDTNFDQKIDGNDHSVAFRLPFQTWLEAKQPILPEPLTSVANNCKFPATTIRYLYLTCAFQGSLDVYRLPLTGQVPANWQEEQIIEAHRSARRYETRLLLLNTLRYRFQQQNISLLERLLSNHLEIGELTAAAFYVKRLTQHYQQINHQPLRIFYQTLDRLLYVKSTKQRVPVGIVTARFQQDVEQQRHQMHQQAPWQRLLNIMDAYLDYEIETTDRALATIKQVDLTQPMLPLERYLAFELYRQLLEVNDPSQLLNYYPVMFNESSLSLEAKLYYAFHYLKLLTQVESDSTARIETINQQAAKTQHPNVAELFRTEIASLTLIDQTDPKQKNQAFKTLNKLLKNNKDNLIVRKILHTRAIQTLGAAEQFKYMELLSRNWLLTTHTSEMEFANVAEQYAVITMDKAYGILSKGNLAKAYSTFYSAIRQTNDLEAHYQFVTLGLTPSLNKKDNLEKSYQLLAKQKLLGQHSNYVAALQRVINSEKQSSKDNNPAWDEALALLQPINTRGLNPSMRDLLMGYIFHQKLRASQKGYYYDKALFQKAHHHYMMAMDLSRDNHRIIVSVWQNLAWLYFEVRQYALASNLFAQRLKLPFVTPDDEASTRWMYARALFYSHDLQPAWQQAETALKLAQNTQTLSPEPFLEKAAFYALQAHAYQAAATHYETLFAQYSLSDHNQAKAQLSYGYALMHLDRQQEATQSLQKVLSISDKLNSLPATTTRLLAYKPKRLQLLAYGLLSKLITDPQQQATYRQSRIQLLTQIKTANIEFAYKESTRLSFVVKDYHHLATAYETAEQYKPMATAMDQALQSALIWVEETRDETGPVIYRTLINYLSLGLSHPTVFAKRNTINLSKTIEQTLQAFTQLPYQSPINISHQTKLSILWEAYRSKALHQTPANLTDRLQNLLKTQLVQQLKTNQPDAYQDLQQLAIHFQNN